MAESIRQKKVADEIRVIIATCFTAEKLRDPRLQGVCISYVKITADLQLASVYFMMNDKSREDIAHEGFRACAGFLRRQVSDGLKLRRIPELRFFYDESLDEYERIDALLSDSKTDR